MRSAVFLAVALGASVAWAGPPTVVRTVDGSVYYGELVERVAKDHVTIVLRTGTTKRFAWKDVDPGPVPPPPQLLVEEPTPGPSETVRTTSGSIYHGEIVEKVPGDHVTLKLADGTIRRVEQADISTEPPRPSPEEVNERPPVENVYTKNGSIYHGEILEKIVHDHVTVKLATGEVKTLEWEDLSVARVVPTEAPSSPPPAKLASTASITFEPDDTQATLERLDTESDVFHTVCIGACEEPAASGRYRVAGRGLVPSSPFLLGNEETQIDANMASNAWHTAGIAMTIVGSLTLIAGLVTIVSAVTASSGFVPNDATGIDVAAVTVNLVGAGLLVAGVAAWTRSSSRVLVNHKPTARRPVLRVDGLHF